MKLFHIHSCILQKLVSTSVLVYLLAGCTTLGPTAIRSGRLAYNNAIIETENQQMLMVAIHNRYQERGNLLAVASVTANVRVRTSAGIQPGIGNENNYAGNLVPFSAGVFYEENPTISYTPVGGEKYMRQLFSPVPISILAQLTGTLSDPAPFYNSLVSSVNGIYNPDFYHAATEPDLRFSRLVAILASLTQAQRLHWLEDPKQDGSFSIHIDRSRAGFETDITKLLALLGLKPPKDPSDAIIIPVTLALDRRSKGGIGITTRSVWDLVEILTASIEIPEKDQKNGITASYPPPGPVGKTLRVRRAEDRPKHASVAVKYRGGWFYIDEKNQATKQYFRLLGTMWSVTIAETSVNSSASPVLTVPVSR
ncbi:MAG: hypothetical protein QNL05_10370 [Gammaproteobacteria bacterium]|nr:hypothetical protein [Gammaproteobacteria bacterium]